MEEAIAAAEALVPGALAAQPAVLFRLQCQRFLELARGPPTALSTPWSPFGWEWAW